MIIIRKVYGFFSSVRFTVVILALIALVSILGTVIRQNADLHQYSRIYSAGFGDIILSLHLHDVYHAPWFYLLIALFALNLALCTVRRTSVLARSRQTDPLPDEPALSRMDLHFILEKRDIHDVAGQLKSGYTVTSSTAEGMVMEKGRLSRFGILIIHGSILVILAGSLVGLMYGYKGSMVLFTGETKRAVTLRDERRTEIILDFAVRCDDFSTKFYPNGMPKDYTSTLTVIDKGEQTLKKDVRVNHPLIYKGIRIYQSSYGSIPSIVFDIGGKIVTLKEREIYERDGFQMMALRYSPSIHGFGPGVLVAYINKGKPETMWFMRDVDDMKKREILGIPVILKDIRENVYTELEVAKDPGVWIVWIGFGLILLGLYLNFFVMHRKVYIRKISNGVLVAGVAQKNKIAFAREFERIRGQFYAR